MLATTLWLGRYWCSHLCPVGGGLELGRRLVPRRLRIDLSRGPAAPFRYGFLAVFMVVPALGLGASSTGSATVTIPSTVAPGSYYLAACADDANVVSESNEANICRLSAEPIDFVNPDLVVTSVSDPTTPVDAGTSFSVNDTTPNSGVAPAGASVTRFRLSLDAAVTSSDPLLTGTSSARRSSW